MRKQWIAMLSLVALLVAGSVAGSAFAQTATPADSDSAAVSAERGDDSDGDASEGAGGDSDGDPSAEEELVEGGAKPGKERFVELLAANLEISVDDAQAALDATYEQLKEERRAAMEQAIRDALAKAVEAGKITQEEADAKIAAFLARIDALEQMMAERREAMEQAVRDMLAKAVESGEITQEEADAKLAEFLEDGDSVFLGGFGKRGRHDGWFGGFGERGGGARGGWSGEFGERGERGHRGGHGGWFGFGGFGFGERTEGTDKNWDDSIYADKDSAA